jgi:methionyl aminopeptidase
MIVIRQEQELAQLRASGRVLARILQQLRQFVKAGVSTADIDKFAEELCAREGVRPAFKGYKGYPASACVSVNEEIIHGIPSDGKIVREGDIVSVDFGIEKQGFFSDAAFTQAVGRIDKQRKTLIEVTRQALHEGIKQAKPDNRIGDIAHAIQSYVERYGFSVVRQFVGHGIGTRLHEEPEVPNYGRAHTGQVLKPGMVLAIEPMVNAGTWESRILDNGWTAVTCDGAPSAHFEHTVAITAQGAEILTA